MKQDRYEVTMETGHIYKQYCCGEERAKILSQAQAIKEGNRYEVKIIKKIN
jgi:hypothetical protein